MGIVDSLNKDGWKPTASTDGEFKPLTGTYKTDITVLRPEIDEKNGGAKYYQLELKPSELIVGDEYGEKFSFRKRYYVDGDKAADNLKALLNVLMTAGVTLDTSSDEALEADFGKAIGKPLFVRSWGWLPDATAERPDPRPVQMWLAQKEAIAIKKKSADSHAF